MASSLSQSAPPSSSSPPAIAAANRTSDTDENDSATSNATVQLASLRAEIADLRERLERADHERAQAGQLGLHLLREKEQLELAHEALLAEYDTAKAELEREQKLLVRLQSQRRSVADSADLLAAGNAGEDGDEDAPVERRYTARIEALESEGRTLSEHLDTYKSEADRLQAEHAGVLAQLAHLETERRVLRDELKELRQREQSLLNDNNELEEENIVLQKQITGLKAAQIEFESAKMEVRRLLEEVLLLQAAADEANKLRSLAERQEEEALTAAHQEREQRIAMKRELERLRNVEHLASLNNIFRDIKDGGAGAGGDGGKQLDTRSLAGGDLFSQLHGVELQEQLEGARAEADQLRALQTAFCHKLRPLLAQLEVPVGDFDEAMLAADPTKLGELIARALSALEKHLSADVRLSPEKSGARREAEEELKKQQLSFRAGLRALAGVAARKQRALHANRARLARLAQQLLGAAGQGQPGGAADRLHRLLPELLLVGGGGLNEGGAGGVEDERLPQGNVTDDGSADEPEVNRSSADGKRQTNGPPPFQAPLLAELNKCLAEEAGGHFVLTEEDIGLLPDTESDEDAEERNRLAAVYTMLADQVRALTTTAAAAQKPAPQPDVPKQGQQLEDEKAELYLTIARLKSRLAAKTEQASSYRTLLRTNKSSSECALLSLREKYETEMRVKDEFLDQLRKELAHYKEDAATFSSFRAMFTARAEEIQAQLAQAQDCLKAADEEKRTLNDLIQLAIKQKLSLNQRVEELEMDRERERFRQQRHHQQHGDGGQQGGGGGRRPAAAASSTAGGGARGGQPPAAAVARSGGGGGGGPTRAVRYPPPAAPTPRGGSGGGGGGSNYK